MLSPSLKITSQARAMPRFLGVVLLSYSAVNFAATPKFLLTPTSRTKATLATNQTATITYKVTNQTVITRTLTIKPISGATQITTGSGACANPFTLSPGSSCDLVLRFVGSPSAATIVGGPVVCKTKSSTNTDPDPFLCSQPATADKLLITRIEAKSQLSISPSSLILTAGSPYTPGAITVTNNSTRTIENVAANLSGTVLASYVTQDSSACTTLTSGASCKLIFTPKSTAVSATSFPIKGTDSTAVGAKITINNPAAPSLSVTNSPLSVTAGSSSALIVKNTSSSVSAYNVTASPLPTALSSAGVTTPAIACGGPILPGNTCSISINAQNCTTAVASTSVVVQATNSNSTATAATGASVAINGTASLSLSPSSLVIYPGTNSTANMTITNNGTLTANSVSADFAGTALFGNVVATTCSSISPGGTCVMTFTANTTTVAATSFPISSSSPVETVTGTIELIGPYIYWSNNSTSAPVVTVCSIASAGLVNNDCADATSSNINAPYGMAVNSSGTYLYVANASSSTNAISLCSINDTDGTLSNCTQLSDSTFSTPYSVFINSAETYAYIANYANATVSICPMTSDGKFSSCTATTPLTTPTFEHPTGIALNPNLNVAYISYQTSSAGYIAQCDISGTTLSNCTSTRFIVDGSQLYGGLTINSTGSIVYAADGNNIVINAGHLSSSTGFITSTDVAILSRYERPRGLAINKGETYLFVATQGYGTMCYISNSVCSAFDYTPTNQFGVALLND